MVNTLPGPKALPLVGSAFYFLQKNPDEILVSLFKLVTNYSSPFQVWIGNKLFIGIYEPDQIKIILQNKHCLNKGVIYKLIEPILGRTSLLTAPNFFLMWGCKDTILGVKLDSRSDIISQCCEVIISCKKSLSYRFKNVFLYSNVIFNLTNFGREQQKRLNFISSVVNKMIQQRQCALNESDTTKNKITYKAFYDILWKASHEEKLTQENIHDNVFTMLVASADTTAITVNFVTFILANLPEIQEKAYEELLEIYGMTNPRSVPVKYEDLQHMDYLDRIIKETLRLFPVVPVIARRLTKDLRMGEIILPKSADIILALGKVHRSKKYWSNPLVFDPDRFLPERLGNSQLCYYMPFSNGPRNCIGMKYAMISIKVILATLIRTFVFKVDESIKISKIKLKFEVLLSPIKPLKVKIEKRNFPSEGM
ncbi:Cytochrome P450 4C1 [Camponotus floridanus]|uniref:Cytochrome P450 4C1 n=1 Tax=Camponotus floridanus TaxID=104421 RepID=E2A2W2_CAMFO|nr:Cytochrome P450 4C1 [Camponotus floridanus]